MARGALSSDEAAVCVSLLSNITLRIVRCASCTPLDPLCHLLPSLLEQDRTGAHGLAWARMGSHEARMRLHALMVLTRLPTAILTLISYIYTGISDPHPHGSATLRDGFRLLDVDGTTPTRWGNWAPASLNDDPLWAEERGLNSVQILAHLICAYRLTGHPELETAFWYLVKEHGCAPPPSRPYPWRATPMPDAPSLTPTELSPIAPPPSPSNMCSYASNMVNQKITAPDDVSGGDNVLAFVPYLAIHYACTLGDAPAATVAMCTAIAPELHTSILRAYAVVKPAKVGYCMAVDSRPLPATRSTHTHARDIARTRRGSRCSPLLILGVASRCFPY